MVSIRGEVGIPLLTQSTMYLLRPICLLLSLALLSGCQNFYCYRAKRESEKNCPTDIRQMVPWCAGEDAIFHCPCGPDCNGYYGYKPTCWGAWTTSGAEWRDIHCGPLVRGAGCPCEACQSGSLPMGPLNLAPEQLPPVTDGAPDVEDGEAIHLGNPASDNVDSLPSQEESLVPDQDDNEATIPDDPRAAGVPPDRSASTVAFDYSLPVNACLAPEPRDVDEQVCVADLEESCGTDVEESCGTDVPEQTNQEQGHGDLRVIEAISQTPLTPAIDYRRTSTEAKHAEQFHHANLQRDGLLLNDDYVFQKEPATGLIETAAITEMLVQTGAVACSAEIDLCAKPVVKKSEDPNDTDSAETEIQQSEPPVSQRGSRKGGYSPIHSPTHPTTQQFVR